MALFKNQRGFSPLIVILIVVILAGLGGAGYYVWSQNKDDNKKDTTSQNNKDKEKEDPQDEEPADPSEGGKYLVIKEWGVRFELPDELRDDVAYRIETTSDKQTAWFEISTIANIPGSGCKLTDATGSGGKGIGVFVVRETQAKSNTAPYYVANIKIGDYWYSGGRERYTESCVNDPTKEQLVGDTRAPLIYALDKLEPITK